MKVVTPQQMRRLDRKAIREAGIPGRVLMENAGEAVADQVRSILNSRPSRSRVILIAGKGNNGGDALVAARLLHLSGVKTVTYLLAGRSDLQEEAAFNWTRLRECHAPREKVAGPGQVSQLSSAIASADLVVDGILGTGLKGTVRGLPARVIKMINASSALVVAVDIPSGLDGETGEASGAAVRAAVTVTMGLPKTGLVRGEGLDYCGRVVVADIGFPPELAEKVPGRLEMISGGELSLLLSPRRPVSHKGSFGRVLVLAGSPGFTGAAALSSRAALRAGAGLVTLGIPESLNPVLEAKCTEVMTLPLPETPHRTFSLRAERQILDFCRRADVAVLGPGLSRNEETGELVRTLVRRCPCPLVIDADGLNLIARDVSLLRSARSSLILTPHPGEMARLTGLPPGEILANREKIARGFARRYGVTVVLKGAGTLIAPPQGTLRINLTGNPGMATGGTGDVLTGLIAGFQAQGLSPLDAACLGVYVHGRAGDRAAEKVGQISLIASDLLEEVPAVLKKIFSWNTSLRQINIYHESTK